MPRVIENLLSLLSRRAFAASAASFQPLRAVARQAALQVSAIYRLSAQGSVIAN
jgi:hypothetical protein